MASRALLPFVRQAAETDKNCSVLEALEGGLLQEREPRAWTPLNSLHNRLLDGQGPTGTCGETSMS